jgi:hypothetical protein
MNKFLLTTILGLFSTIFIYGQSPEVENIKIKNKVNFRPVFPTADNSKLPAKAGDVFYNDTDSSLYLFTGKSYRKMAYGEILYEDLTINYNEDTVNFEPLPYNYGFNVTFDVVANTLNANNDSLDFQETYNSDSTYYTINSSILPYPLTAAQKTPTFGRSIILKYQRAILHIGSSVSGYITIRRKIRVY